MSARQQADWDPRPTGPEGTELRPYPRPVEAEQPISLREGRLLTEQIKPTGQESTVNQQQRGSTAPACEVELKAFEVRSGGDSKAAARCGAAQTWIALNVHVR